MRKIGFLLAVILLCLGVLNGCGPKPQGEEATRPEPTGFTQREEQPEPTEPEPTKPEPTKPEPTEPEPTKPEPTEPTKVPETESTEPVVRNPYHTLQETLREKDCVLGIAYVGSLDYDSSKENMKACLEGSQIAQDYAFLLEGTLALSEEYSGQEVYALVPANGYRVSVYPNVMVEDEDYAEKILTEEPIYEGAPGEIVILRCNVSDIFPNTAVFVKGGQDELRFYPMLSGRDGHVVTWEGIWDFSIYEDVPMDEND